MKILRNKKGMGLPMVLGITVFVIGLSATLMSYIVFQSRIVEFDIDESEAYHNSVSNVSAAINIMANNQDMTEQEILELGEYLNVDIELTDSDIYIITSMIDESNQVISYMTKSTVQTTIDEVLFDFDGQEDSFELSPLITPKSMLSEFIPDFVSEVLDLTIEEEDINDFEDLMDYLEDLPDNLNIPEISNRDIERYNTPIITQDTYVDDDIEIDRKHTLIIEDSSMLFIDGELELDKQSSLIIRNNSIVYIDDDLKIDELSDIYIEDGSILFVNEKLEIDKNSTVYGNIFVNDDAKIEKNTSFEGTLYVRRDLTIEENVQLGSSNRPSFIFVEDDIEIEKNVSGYAYIMGEDIEIEKNVSIIGGVYAHDDLDLEDRRKISIQNYEFQNISKLFDYAIPNQLSVISGDGGENSDESDFVFTYPKLN